MKQTFDEWCGERICKKCRFRASENLVNCRDAYEKGMEVTYLDIKRIEDKMDAMIKHFNVPTGEE